MDFWRSIVFAFAIACNAKNFAVAILVFFLFFLPIAGFGRSVKSFFKNILSFVTEETYDQDRTDFIGHI